MEFLVNYQFLQTKPVLCQLIFGGSESFKFKDFLLMVQMIIQETTAVPDAQWNVGVDLSTTSGLNCTLLLVKWGQCR
jgi:iron complex outermembrane receptor protein